jgi:acyl carrier protein
MKNKVFDVISKVIQVPVERIDEDSSPETIEGWDSLKHMNLILSLEEEFNVQFTYEEIVEMVTVRKILEKLEERA